MSAVDRVEYFDNQKAGILTESITKEKKCVLGPGSGALEGWLVPAQWPRRLSIAFVLYSICLTDKSIFGVH